MNSMSPLTGNLFVISAPSGTGKTSLVAALCEELCGIVASVSYTTRAQRDQETNGIHYRFVSEVRFKEMLRAGAFLEHARVFGNFYGTAEAAVQSELPLALTSSWKLTGREPHRFSRPSRILVSSYYRLPLIF